MDRKINPIKSATQRHIEVADITNDVVLTKNGGAALVLQATAVNFSLLSEGEQEALTLSYAAFLNSLSFPIQILIKTHSKDVSKYLSFLKNKEEQQTNPMLKKLMVSYSSYVSQIVKKKNVLEKEFFIVIPFSPLELGISAGSFFDLVSPKKKRRVSYPKEYIIKRAKTALYPKRDHILRQTGRLGIKVRQLTTDELINLFIKNYNPGSFSISEAENNNVN